MGTNNKFCYFSATTTMFFWLFLVLFHTANGVSLPPNVVVPAIFVFGDSIVDSGNNNQMKTLAKSNFAPYGQDFEGGVPTGRFSNGKVPSDLIAEDLGIKDTVPAYMDPKLKSEDLETGICFASGGAGFDPLTSQLAACIPLPQQLDNFKQYIPKLKGIVGEEKSKFIFDNSLFLLAAGSDDIANTYFLLPIRNLHYDVNSYTDLMLTQASTFLKDLYDLGARRILVVSLPPIGCVPSQRTVGGGIKRDCAEKLNQAAILFNTKLAAKLDSFNANLPNSRMIYADIYYPLLDIIQYPSKYGFEVSNKGCCGTGVIEAAYSCNPLTPTLCKNHSAYVFWDAYHPTETTYRTIIEQLIPKVLPRFL